MGGTGGRGVGGGGGMGWVGWVGGGACTSNVSLSTAHDVKKPRVRLPQAEQLNARMSGSSHTAILAYLRRVLH